MKFTDAIRWGLYDRVLAFASLALGLAIAVGALWIGTGSWLVDTVVGGGSATPAGQSLAISAVGVVVGLLIWQIGSAAARHRTMVSATEKRVHRRLAGEDMDAGGSLDARIDQLESDVEEVRRVASRIEQSMREGEFAADGLDDSAGSAAGGSGTATDAGADDAATAGAAAAAGGGATGDSADAASTDAAAADGAAGQSDGLQFSDDEAAESAEAQQATSTTDGGTPTGDDPDEDGFEWPEEDDEGEYYRNS